jgi:Ion channel
MITESEPAAGAGKESVESAPAFRYVVVLVLTLLAVVVLIGATNADWSRAVALGLEGVALVVTVATSRARGSVRRRRARVVGAVMVAGVILVGIGAPRWFTAVFGIAITAAVPVALVRGLLRLLVRHGVTIEAVAGAVAIYLSLGLMFAWIIALDAAILGSAPYFAQHTSGTQGEKVYFSFTVLTTTGFGDFTPRTASGRAIAVLEMLTGQLYLVTVIGLLIGNFAAHRRRVTGPDDTELDEQRREQS